MYYELFNLLSFYIYGADAVLTGDQNLVLTVLATTGVIFVVSIPFILVYRFVRLFA